MTNNELQDFYDSVQENGAKKLFVELNNKYSEIADDLKGIKISLNDEDKKFERFLKLVQEAGTMLDNYRKMENYMLGKKEEPESVKSGKTKTIFEKEVDAQRG